MSKEPKVKPETKKPRPGRPRVFAEGLIDLHISVTPDQRDWLEAQPGLISVTVRRLIDEARKKDKPDR